MVTKLASHSVKTNWWFVNSELYGSEWRSSEIGRCTTWGKGHYFPFGRRACGSQKWHGE